MPTGYTYQVVEGKVTELSEFAMECARAFGALIMLRDDPKSEIPDEFAPSSFYSERLQEARSRLAELQAMTPAEAELAATEAHKKAVMHNQEFLAKREQEDARLEAMIEKVLAWQPPTAEHVGLKDFMLEQLRISKSGSYMPEVPELLSGTDWLRRQIEEAHDSIGRYAAENEKEIARSRGRTEWVKRLRASLEPDNTSVAA